MRAIPQLATDFIAEHEALKLESYTDSAGCVTIGYGHTGPEVHAGLRWDEPKCRAALYDDLKVARARLYAKIKREVIEGDLTDHQWSALLSFAFNLGIPGTTIWQRLNARQFDQVPVEIMRFCYVTDPKTKRPVKLQGLVNRRAAEVALWSTAEPGSVPDNPPSSFTRAEETPPVEAPKPAGAKLTAISAGAITTLAAVQTGAQQVQSMVAPQADKSPWLGKLLSLTAVLIVAAGVAVLALHWLQSKAAKR